MAARPKNDKCAANLLRGGNFVASDQVVRATMASMGRAGLPCIAKLCGPAATRLKQLPICGTNEQFASSLTSVQRVF